MNEVKIKRSLEKGEKLIWAGKPDTRAFLRGLPRMFITTNNPTLDNPLYRRIFYGIVAVALVALVISGVDSGTLEISEFIKSKPVFLILIFGSILFLIIKFFTSKIRHRKYAESLSYAISNQRILIFRNGVIEEEFTPVEVSPKLIKRRNVSGFSDIIWGNRRLNNGGGSSQGRRASDFEIELARVGFKALSDVEAVLQKITAWRNNQIQDLAKDSEVFLNEKKPARENEERINEENSGDEKSEQGYSDREQSSINIPKSSRKIQNTTLGFSIELPKDWEVKVRKRRLAFGKWGLEKEAVWSDEDDLTKWNVLKGKSSLNSYVEIQVHKTKPINTFEKLVESNTGVAGVAELVDKNPSFAINGLKGFYVTRKTGGDSIPIVGSMINIPVTYTRMHIFHDGQRQFYIEASWPVDAPAEAKVCEAIVSTLMTN